MYEDGAGSVAETTHRALSAAKPPPDVVFDHREGPDPESFDWDDDRQLEAALREAYGPAAEWMDLPGIVREIRDPETDKNDAVRYFLNRPASAETDFIPLSDWDRLRIDARLEPGDRICVGFDGSRGGDSTGIVGVRASDGLTVPLGLWERTSKIWELPRQEVHAKVAEIFSTYRVARWYGDSRFWETDHDRWADQYGADRVLELPQSVQRLHESAQRVVTQVKAALAGVEVDELPGFCHTGDVDLRRHVGNARRDRAGGRGSADGRWKLGKKAPSRHIDLAAATTFAWEALGDAIRKGELMEDPGLVVYDLADY